ncbi:MULTISPECIES: TetR/AcrR family transcriptional regulator [Streptomyces]|uniref:Transcriptional regulator, TetR family n=1 Tax=Streptomyces griseoaurantiacus TaxID=68213 RepID=A0A1G7DYR0_9ACTN|nr:MULTISPECIES: TetR family transcriptional regulator [Streptomyces]GHE43553.1 TetR family transcriptional regulator [Streptomyces griseoaurantiacus]MCF0088289.1 HTH-type transcriptional repressor [Streptomyces sp. MH192]MCF0102143.1 HTH-type transcriptional repressor [Streptomyces sp. MH191]MDX3089407.1 TetR family transcriptional regulator [Streptomyces sp. ME12-02E]MDX3332873.1 TetR family transcriptional regulator [Streptomyces sp. ME02-6978a]
MSEREGAAEATDAPRRRRRDPEGHRADILRAARETFAERGYARTTLREIARRAGVTHGLITRHFASKERLFLAAVPGNRDLEQVTPGPPDTLPDRIARAFVQRMETDAVNDPLVALVRSAASDQGTAAELLSAMQERSVDAYRAVLTADASPGPGEARDDLDERVALVGAQLIGITVGRYIARTEPLASMPPERLVAHLTRALRHILFD